MNKLKWTLFIVIMGSYIYCSNKEEDRFDYFFSKIDKTLSKAEKAEIKNCPDIGCLVLYISSKAPRTFLDSFRSVPPEILSFFKDSLKIQNVFDHQRILITAYQKKLNNKNIDYTEIINEIMQFDKTDEQRYLSRYERELQALSDIARNNYLKYDIGDTINLLYPVKKSGNVKYVYFNNFYSHPHYDDTLFLTTIITNKAVENYTDTVDHKRIDYHFWLKILEARNPELEIIDRKYSQDSIIFLSLFDYGRKIE